MINFVKGNVLMELVENSHNRPTIKTVNSSFLLHEKTFILHPKTVDFL